MLYEKLSDGQVRCHLCAHRCAIADGKKGICQVRENRGGTLYTLVYGRTIARHVDPVEMQVERRAFYQPAEILRDLQDKVERAKEAGEPVGERVHRELQSGISARHCRGIRTNIEPRTKKRARSCVKSWKDLFI
jgi:hypothetical protein